MILAGTGHRPPRLGLGWEPEEWEPLVNFLRIKLDSLGNNCSLQVLSGMALGFDMSLAIAAMENKVPFQAIVPCDDYEKNWSSKARKIFEYLCSQAFQVTVVCPGPYTHEKNIVRDHYLVDHADQVLALWDGQLRGGTALTVRYAHRKKKPVLNLWEEWTQ